MFLSTLLSFRSKLNNTMGFLIKAAAGNAPSLFGYIVRKNIAANNKVFRQFEEELAKQQKALSRSGESGSAFNGAVRSFDDMAGDEFIRNLVHSGALDASDLRTLLNSGLLKAGDITRLGLSDLITQARRWTDRGTRRYLNAVRRGLSDADNSLYKEFALSGRLREGGIQAVQAGVFNDVLHQLAAQNGGKLSDKIILQARFLSEHPEYLLRNNRLDIDNMLTSGLARYNDKLADTVYQGFHEVMRRGRQHRNASAAGAHVPHGKTPGNTPGQTPPVRTGDAPGNTSDAAPPVRTGDAAGDAAAAAASAAGAAGGKVRKGLLGWRNLGIGAGIIGLGGLGYAMSRPGEVSDEADRDAREAPVDLPSTGDLEQDNAALNHYTRLQNDPYRQDNSMTGPYSVRREGFDLNSQHNKQLANLLSSQPGSSPGFQPGIPPSGALFDAIRLYRNH